MDDRKKELLGHLNRLATEKPNPKSKHIDRLKAVDICRIINEEDQTIAAALDREISHIARAAEMAAEVLGKGGRLFYIGAGTSGRLGVLDAAECPPTFGTDPSQVIGVIAGGRDTLVRSAEGVEDRFEEATQDLQKHDFGPNDMLVGLAASIKTPYTVAGIEYATEIGHYRFDKDEIGHGPEDGPQHDFDHGHGPPGQMLRQFNGRSAGGLR
jgi:N-acetylmuramic acid 6-phosphate etherase